MTLNPNYSTYSPIDQVSFLKFINWAKQILPQSTSFLDIGSGPGVTLAWASSYFTTLTGIDYDPEWCINNNIINVDAFNYTGYNQFDVLYCYSPIINDTNLNNQLKTIILNNMKIGAVYIDIETDAIYQKQSDNSIAISPQPPVKQNFTDTIHCSSRLKCFYCRNSESWRKSMANVTNWDTNYTCPIGLPIGATQDQIEQAINQSQPTLISLNQSKGLGDTIKKITDATGITKVVEKIEKATGKDCGCGKRQEKLNELFPYNRENKTK